ncbi:MAG: hypothetical protein ACXVRW_14210 [Solirubrobacteraceae bacterium]
MVLVTIVIAILLVVALVYIVALLRSHADILRRLAALEEGAATGHRAEPPPSVDGAEVLTAAPIAGTTLRGDSVTLAFGPGSPVTLLAFLTSGCASCAPLWDGVRTTLTPGSLAERVAVITHDATRESPTRLERLAPPASPGASRAEVIMSSAAWTDYAVPESPHFVLTDGAGGILGRGSALSWSQLETMVADARADARRALQPRDAGAESARTTAERAERSERALASAGITPGHPSLYPGATGGQDR